MSAFVDDKKLTQAITHGVSVTEEEIIATYKMQYAKTGKSLSHMRETIRERILDNKKQERLKQWWEEQYRKSNIQILDSSFKEVLNK